MERTVGSRIAEARRNARLSQEELARRTGYGISAIRSWEQGVRHPRPRALEKLAAILGRPVSWFYAEPGSSREAA
jgi:transcriptional regulator with XRE-family HTH domain